MKPQPVRPIVDHATVLNLEAKARGIGLHINYWTRITWEPADAKGVQRAWLEVNTGSWERLVPLTFKPGHRGFPYTSTRQHIEVCGRGSKILSQALRALQVQTILAIKHLNNRTRKGAPAS